MDALANNIPFLCYTIGLGSVSDELLRRIANDPTAAAYQVAYAAGIYVNSPDAAHLNSAFATIASDLLRLSK